MIDKSKFVTRLGERATVPIEIIPESPNLVRTRLLDEFSTARETLRQAGLKDGPVITENRNLILDVAFDSVNADVATGTRCDPGSCRHWFVHRLFTKGD